MFTALKKSGRVAPLLVHISNGRCYSKAGSARWLPTRNHFLIANQPRGGAHECEHDVEYVGMAVTCATYLYLLPTCRIYVDKSGHISGAKQSGGSPPRGLHSWSCEGFDWLPRLAREVRCSRAADFAILERREIW